MKVKVGDKIYDGEKEPVMVILTPKERDCITNMATNTEKFCSYPETKEWIENNYKKIKKWMET